MLEHDRSRWTRRGPTDQCRRQLIEQRVEERGANDRVACPCPPAICQICSPRMSITVPTDSVSSKRLSTLGEVTAQMLHDWLAARERSCLRIELDKYPVEWVPRCNRPPIRPGHRLC